MEAREAALAQKRAERAMKRALRAIKHDPFNPDLWDAVDPSRAALLRQRQVRRWVFPCFLALFLLSFLVPVCMRRYENAFLNVAKGKRKKSSTTITITPSFLRHVTRVDAQAKRDATMERYRRRMNPPPPKAPPPPTFDEQAAGLLVDDDETNDGTMNLENLFEKHFDGGE